MKKTISNLKYKWWFKLLSKPDIYLKGLLINSLYIGIISAIILIVFQKYAEIHQQTIPPTFHSILGLVLGLLLVFRTNTAYDRWWNARAYFAKIEAYYIYIASKIKIKENEVEAKRIIKEILIPTLSHLEHFLVENHDVKVKQKFLDVFYKLQRLNNDREYDFDTTLKEILDMFTSLERIRDTPIPMAYSLHIKVSIFIYFLSLPFGVLYETGYWSILLVMILYYIVAGIEIVSNEIENPFYGDPNDLPVKFFLDNLKEELLRKSEN